MRVIFYLKYNKLGLKHKTVFYLLSIIIYRIFWKNIVVYRDTDMCIDMYRIMEKYRDASMNLWIVAGLHHSNFIDAQTVLMVPVLEEICWDEKKNQKIATQ